MTFRAKLNELRLRTSDRYELVLHDRLRPSERQRFAELTADPDHWGVLRPLGVGSYRAVDRETALLLLTLREPGPLPAYVLESGDRVHSNRAAARIRAMILDGILDAETADGVAFDGLDIGLGSGLNSGEVDATRIDARSLAALRYGVALRIDDVAELTTRLYLYGGEPLTRSIRRRLSTRTQIVDFLQLGAKGNLRKLLPTGWTLDAGAEKPWIYLRREGAQMSPGCKLYVGSAFVDLLAVLGAVIDGLAGSRAPLMKIGGSASDLVRCDKIVVYFPALEDLQAYAAKLASSIEHLAGDRSWDSLGVPFTAAADSRGMLTWGVDPPASAIPLSGTFTESWRAWLASRAASAIVGARRTSDPDDIEPVVRATIERLKVEGVDVRRWTPEAHLWSDAS